MVKQALTILALLSLLFTAFLTAPVSGSLIVTDGEKITSPYGNTSAVITITGDDFPDGGTITIDVLSLCQYVYSGTFADLNIEVSSDADNATWSGMVSGIGNVDQIITLTSNGTTLAGESVIMNFTGAKGNPWLPGSSDIYGEVFAPLAVTITDTGEPADIPITFWIETPTITPGGLTITDGVKITSSTGATSPLIAIADTDIPDGSTLIINVPPELNLFTDSGAFTDVNLEISTKAAAATWSGDVSWVRCDRCEGGVNQMITLTSNGTTHAGESVNVTFTGANGNPWLADSFTSFGDVEMPLIVTRTDTFQKADPPLNFRINTTPPAPPVDLSLSANFTASPTSGIAPQIVNFLDTSLGTPTEWSWDFGDRSAFPTDQNPAHTYTKAGSYTVNLTVTNANGTSNVSKTNYINTFNGVSREADTEINGLSITNCESQQTITVYTTILSAVLSSDNSTLEIQPPSGNGFQNITFYALDGVGFSHSGTQITGNPTGVHLVSVKIAPDLGFSDTIGKFSSFNYSMDLASYPCNASLSTKIWEGMIPGYDTKLRLIADGNNASVVGTAYTAEITKTNFPSNATAILHMSVNSSWKTMLRDPTGQIFIWRIADDGNSGQILPTTFTYNDTVNNLDYYTVESPLGLSTFGISSLTGNNNPFQMITLILSEIISPPENIQSSDSGAPVPVAVITRNTTSPTTKSTIPQDPGKTARIYANANGVITQATMLQSSDGFAAVNISTGIVAKNLEGKALSSVTIKAIPSENLPGSSPGSSFSFAGRAYELQPDGATFSPGISISFTAPTTQFGQILMVKLYDNATDTWQDVPSSTNPQTGVITAHISHFCCLALFAKTVTSEPASAGIPAPAQTTPKIIAPAPTPMSTFVGMILWLINLIQKNMIIFAGLIILAIAIFLYGRKRRRDSLMYLF